MSIINGTSRYDPFTIIEMTSTAGELDEGQVAAGEFVVAGCDAAIVLDAVEEAFDEIAMAIAMAMAIKLTAIAQMATFTITQLTCKIHILNPRLVVRNAKGI